MPINGHDILQHWITHPDVQLYRRTEATTPRWCAQSQTLVAWGTKRLLPWVSHNPTPETIAYAKSLAEERYWWLYGRVDDDHRRDERHATHPCLHQALMELRFAIEDTLMHVPIPKLLPPTQPAPAPRVIEAEDEPFEEMSGILDGLGESG